MIPFRRSAIACSDYKIQQFTDSMFGNPFWALQSFGDRLGALALL
jgi:hypothetical protein